MAATIRSFIAIDIPSDAARGLGRVIRRMAQKWPEYRWADPQTLHLTLNFLGNVPDEKLPRVCEILRETLANHSRFSFELQGLGAFPKATRPKVIWVGVGEGKSPLSRLFYDFAQNLEELRLDRDRKAFRPHISLARIQNGERWPDSMVAHLTSEPPTQIGLVSVDEVLLYSSHQEKSGSVHTVMDRVALA
ncbi:MAG: RNA 2',3'-cyclic phosphodiesterase [Planctomycetaceae bacterium]|nr:RNA 2',3'-cyclic phosphodiesterase [Planctomycetaceae bacterium]MCP4462742.1 RNA 2',3'-cyclic phosphodiesterase [Planctomycetaceae bacterium]MDG1806374.1 RNA 2',3'-cyclic phosphodiesterase [Pirellulaceae bacterium]MDG2103899.1 RNA 2',3'-cyclic phosphodiesterase [Pirellulaceae bacterium]